ncbi:DNA-binding response regulator [Trinickia dabaoshanensis]|uniref:DNA-binding response regulator n=1 Tax=Trinickia dabaoshanensis TaxID=564714 RepID=A0A2N7VRP2_9BURK|nr:response regulator transcription factor [Trinickia dabaoshanensis]PMS19806.1 DNA-binding response regulator [Trinickia dabaoshanensis]
MATETIKVLLVDDHTIVRNGVRLMLSSAADIEVAAEAASAIEATRAIEAQRFDVALVDIALPGKNGLDLLKSMQASHPELAVLILSTYAEDIYAMRALKLGAAGYLTKDSSAATLIEAVRKASKGGKYVSPSLAERFASVMSGKSASTHEVLSDRELEVLKLLARGESLVNIGERLHLSPKTVTTYRSRILDKMGLGSNAELTRYALENGLLS